MGKEENTSNITLQFYFFKYFHILKQGWHIFFLLHKKRKKRELGGENPWPSTWVSKVSFFSGWTIKELHSLLTRFYYKYAIMLTCELIVHAKALNKLASPLQTKIGKQGNVYKMCFLFFKLCYSLKMHTLTILICEYRFQNHN